MSDTARDYQVLPAATTDGLDDLFATSARPFQDTVREVLPYIQDSVLNSALNIRDTVQEEIRVLDAALLLNVDRRSVVRLLNWNKLSGRKDDRGRWLITKRSVLERLSEKDKVQDNVQVDDSGVQDSARIEDSGVQDSARIEDSGVQDSVRKESGHVLEDVSKSSQAYVRSGAMTSPDNLCTHESIELVTELRQQILALKTELDKKVSEAQKEIQAAAFRNGYLESQLAIEREQVKLLTDSQHKAGWWRRFYFWFIGR